MRRPSGRAQIVTQLDEAVGGGQRIFAVWRVTIGDMMVDEDDRHAERRRQMVREQLEARGIRDPRVLDAMRRIPRHRFVPPELEPQAYADHPLPIGSDQTISQPYIVAYMTEALALRGTERVLEVGTGCGYQTAVLAELAAEVFSVEIIQELAERARRTLDALGYQHVAVRVGDGQAGWPEEAPFHAILAAAAPDAVPPSLVEQLVVGGRLVMPIGRGSQTMIAISRTTDGLVERRLIDVRFVPMTGGTRPV